MSRGGSPTGIPFEPMLIGASIIPLLGMLAVLAFVRNNRATEQGVVKPI